MEIQETTKNVEFGSYPQTVNGDIQPIEWQFLAIENNKMLLLSKYGLDCKIFDVSSNDWKNSEIRQWLNGEFYNKSFSEKERKNINPLNLSDVGTTDNVFLLSKEEVERYFANNKSRRCKATAYAVKNGAWVDEDCSYSWWWIRSPYPNLSSQVYFVNTVGVVGDYYHVNYYCVFVRPALWVNL